MLLILLTMDTCLVQFSNFNILADKDGWHRIQKRQHKDCLLIIFLCFLDYALLLIQVSKECVDLPRNAMTYLEMG
jgi:hypothetical protein